MTKRGVRSNLLCQLARTNAQSDGKRLQYKFAKPKRLQYIVIPLKTSHRFCFWRPDFKVAEAEHMRSCICSMQATLKGLGTRPVSGDAKTKSDQKVEVEPLYTPATGK